MLPVDRFGSYASFFSSMATVVRGFRADGIEDEDRGIRTQRDGKVSSLYRLKNDMILVESEARVRKRHGTSCEVEKVCCNPNSIVLYDGHY